MKLQEALDLVANELMAACETDHESDKDMQEKIDTAWQVILKNIKHDGGKQ